jgi:hypothetical protein
LKEWLPNADDVIKAVKKLCINNTINMLESFIIHLFDLLFKQHYEKFLFTVFIFCLCNFAFINKVSGIVVDKADQPVPLQI